MKNLLDALEMCKNNKLFDKHINIALGKNKIPMTIKEGINQLRFKK